MDERDDISDELIKGLWKEIEGATGVSILNRPIIIDEAWQPIIENHIKRVIKVDR